jgi:hypothetical protein
MVKRYYIATKPKLKKKGKSRKENQAKAPQLKNKGKSRKARQEKSTQ